MIKQQISVWRCEIPSSVLFKVQQCGTTNARGPTAAVFLRCDSPLRPLCELLHIKYTNLGGYHPAFNVRQS